MNNLPEIRIKDAWLLRMNASRHLHELWSKDGDRLASDEEMEEIVKNYEEAWRGREEQILKSLTNLYGLSFRKNIIDVHIAPWFNAFSEPLVIGVTNDPDEFIDVLAHELLHCLFVDNTNLPYKNNALLKEWQSLFGEDYDFNTLVHIPVHAGMKYLYLDVLKEPYRLDRDLEKPTANKDSWGKPYVDAWDYVEEHGYKEINKQLKDSYLKLKSEH